MFADGVEPLFSNDETTSVQSNNHRRFGEKRREKEDNKG